MQIPLTRAERTLGSGFMAALIVAMSRLPLTFQPQHCYHITTRCNNREFRLTRFECRQLLLYALRTCQSKYGFKLYGLCIMSNHVHYLLEPAQPEDVPKITAILILETSRSP
jgi:putative transposase